MSRRPPAVRRLGIAALACAVVLALAGCGGTDESAATPEPDQVYLPSDVPTTEVPEMLDPPADYNRVDGEGYQIFAPGEYQRRQTTSSNGEPMLVLEAPSGIPAVPQRVAVIRDVEPRSSAAEQSYALETAKGAAGPAAEVTRVSLPAPEGQAAFLVRWRETRPGKGAANVDVVYWQLMQQVSDELILNVVAFAPAEQFETSEVSKILRTFVAGKSA